MRSITILGATGSIGASTVDLLKREPDRYRVESISARRNAAALGKIAREVGARHAVVADPSAYGLVRLNDDNSVRGFVEKPAADQIDTNRISAGAYVLERSVLDLIPPDRNVSIERDVWPWLVNQGLYGFPAEAYWLDIGTPERYLQGTFDILEGNVRTAVAERLGDNFLSVDERVEAQGRDDTALAGAG